MKRTMVIRAEIKDEKEYADFIGRHACDPQVIYWTATALALPVRKRLAARWHLASTVPQYVHGGVAALLKRNSP